MVFSCVKPHITTTTINPCLLAFNHQSIKLKPKPAFKRSSWRLLPPIRAIDAAQPFDYESQLQSQYLRTASLKIAIVGFGNFGQFLGKAFARHNHTLLLHSRSDYTHIAQQLNATFYNDIHDLCEQHPDVVLISTSILSTESVLKAIPFQRLKRSTLFVDVLSVKEFPRNLFLKYLPLDFDILCTHPMFGPESGKDSWVGLPFVYDKVRVGDDEERVRRVERFLDIFAKEGCRMVEMSCGEHDRYAAGSQFVTHTMGLVLEGFDLQSSPINTKGYETLLSLVGNTKGIALICLMVCLCIIRTLWSSWRDWIWLLRPLRKTFSAACIKFIGSNCLVILKILCPPSCFPMVLQRRVVVNEWNKSLMFFFLFSSWYENLFNVFMQSPKVIASTFLVFW